MLNLTHDECLIILVDPGKVGKRIVRNCIYLSPELINKQNLTLSDVSKLKELHQKIYAVKCEMTRCNSQKKLRQLSLQVRDLSFKLQKTWRFPEDENMHEWYEVPKCSCPKLDNRERKGTPYKVIDDSCIIHGGDL